MTDETELGFVERMLQRTPAPETVPAALGQVARGAALGAPPAVTRAPRRRRMPAWWRVAAPAAAFGAAVAAAVAIVIGGTGGGFATQLSLSLQGPNGAAANVDFGKSAKGVRQMVVHVSGLPQAAKGHYYEMWFRTGGHDNVSAVTFNTSAGGDATFRAVIPAGMSWRSCWVTREKIGGPESGTTVLTT